MSACGIYRLQFRYQLVASLLVQPHLVPAPHVSQPRKHAPATVEAQVVDKACLGKAGRSGRVNVEEVLRLSKMNREKGLR